MCGCGVAIVDSEATGKEEAEEGGAGLGGRQLDGVMVTHHSCSELCLQVTQGGRSNIRGRGRNHFCHFRLHGRYFNVSDITYGSSTCLQGDKAC